MNKNQNRNEVILNLLSIYLNDYSKSINKDDLMSIMSCGVSSSYAFALLLANLFDLNPLDSKENNDFFNDYLIEMLKELNINDYISNAYYQNIKLTNVKKDNWKIKQTSYKPGELFVYDDFKIYLDGRVIPQVGFFMNEFEYPAIYESNRLWMSITPNEINTMKLPIKKSFGKVLTCGLGMGYFPYMISLKEEVKEITIIEKDQTVIDLFKEIILPQFEHGEKIKIICDDAIDYLNKNDNFDYDFVFVDLWHDVSDAIDKYLTIKLIEDRHLNSKFYYWIEETIKCYLK